MSRRQRKRARLIADLNLTNLIDVIFTLLIIFMITAPMMTQGVQVDLPKAEAQNVKVNKSIQVSINGRNEIFVDQEKVSLIDFRRRFGEVFSGQTQKSRLFVNADKRVPYGLVIRIIADVQNAGVVKLGFMTLPLDKSGGI